MAFPMVHHSSGGCWSCGQWRPLGVGEAEALSVDAEVADAALATHGRVALQAERGHGVWTGINHDKMVKI
jgi:hypothetical protein